MTKFKKGDLVRFRRDPKLSGIIVKITYIRNDQIYFKLLGVNHHFPKQHYYKLEKPKYLL